MKSPTEYHKTIANEGEDEEETVPRKVLASYTAPKDALMHILDDVPQTADPILEMGNSKNISARENEYQSRRLLRDLSPDRVDPFSKKASKDRDARGFKEVMRHVDLDREKNDVLQQMRKAGKQGYPVQESESKDLYAKLPSTPLLSPKSSYASSNTAVNVPPALSLEVHEQSEWEVDEAVVTVPAREWDSTPKAASESGSAVSGLGKRSRWDETPRGNANTSGSVSGWDATPKSSVDGATIAGSSVGGDTPKRSRWDQTPTASTPAAYAGMATPTAEQLAQMTPREQQDARANHEAEFRNRLLSDEELNNMIPFDGFTVLEPPVGYNPIRTPARKLMSTPAPMGSQFSMGESLEAPDGFGAPIPFISGVEGLNYFKQEDAAHFSKLMEVKDDFSMTTEEIKDRKIMRLLLKIKNGQPAYRKQAMRQITEGARLFGASALFNQILPLLMSPTLEDQERHLLVKVIDRVMFKLDDLVRPYVHKILVVIEPLLIDEDFFARAEGREIISNLAKAAGLASMISVMRPDIDHVDEYVRNTTARAFSVVASALGVQSLLPFLKAVCKSKKSWQARHTGIKIIQQLAILIGCAVLPHLRSLVDCIGHGLEDDNQKVRNITALSLAALAEAATPYGIESFGNVIPVLMDGLKKHRGKGLAAFFKAIGNIVPLFDPDHGIKYIRAIMGRLLDCFDTPDEEMKKIVLKVIRQCIVSPGVDVAYIKSEILPNFFTSFWVRRMALDRRNYKVLVETTVAIAGKIGVSFIILKIVDGLKDESEPYRRMVIETVDSIVKALGSADIDDRLQEVLIDGILYAFQEQSVEDQAFLSAFGTVVNSLGLRVKPYLPQICSTILWRLNNKSAKVRQQSADLISLISGVMRSCGEEKLMGQLGVVLYEYLGEEFPEVLGSIIAALKSIVNVIGMSNMTPPIKDLLPRLTPILKNRHEKVQEHCVDLVGRIADRGAEFVSAREWMRICFELLDMLKAPRKGIRRAAVNTFGYIAKAIGPQDVLATLLNNLKVQERQNRVCTTVAIAIVAETCSPFTILPALMNEYRVPELNVQNGVLKSISFLFEYIGETGKDYIYAVTPLIEDALMDRDLVHRQTACTAVKHMALGVYGMGCEDAMHHLLNLVWPNVLETSPHVINAVLEAFEGLRVALGPAVVFSYVLQGLFHPARRVREIYWKIYNMIYLGSQHALVPYYPRLPEYKGVAYHLDELDIIV